MPDIDPRLALAFSLHSSPGTIALLVGSGLSSSAGIPTGWEIVLDLIKRLARLRGEEPTGDPAAWYEETFGTPPHYADLLRTFGRTQAERAQLLRPYFEATDEDREANRRVPQPAHRAIAELVRSGYIKVIITTNFDTLIEQALEAVGVNPTVISTVDGLRGALPLQHQSCLLLKLHGDYRDVRIRNTEDELQQYERPLRLLLDRILDEYGLLVVGWSAEWDVALRAAFERCTTRRFTTFWATRGRPREHAARLISARGAQLLTIHDADELLIDVHEKVAALEALDRSHPNSVAAAVSAAKSFLPEERHIIRLDNLLMTEVDTLLAKIRPLMPPTQNFRLTYDAAADLLRKVDAASETILHLMSTVAFWSSPSQDEILRRALTRVANAFYVPVPGMETRVGPDTFFLYPALPLLYGAWMGGLAAGKYSTLAMLFEHVMVLDYRGNRVPAAQKLVPGLFDDGIAQKLRPPTNGTWKTPLSDHLLDLIKPAISHVLGDEGELAPLFDRFEYLLSLISADWNSRDGALPYSFIGRFVWRREQSVLGAFDAEIAELGTNWPPLQAGLFKGDVERVKAVKAEVDTYLRGHRHRF